MYLFSPTDVEAFTFGGTVSLLFWTESAILFTNLNFKRRCNMKSYRSLNASSNFITTANPFEGVPKPPEKEKCSRCNGSGVYNGSACTKCAGSGRVG